AGAGVVDVQMLVIEDVDREAAVLGSGQAHEDEQLAVMDADHTERPDDTVFALNLREVGNHRRAVSVEPAVHAVPADLQVGSQRIRRRPRRPEGPRRVHPAVRSLVHGLHSAHPTSRSQFAATRYARWMRTYRAG